MGYRAPRSPDAPMSTMVPYQNTFRPTYLASGQHIFDMYQKVGLMNSDVSGQLAEEGKTFAQKTMK